MSIKNFYFCTVTICLLLTSICLADPNDLPYKQGELLIRFAPELGGVQRTTAERNQVLSSLNAGEVKHSFKRVPGLTLVTLPENLKVEDALVQLKGKSEFLYVEPNWKISFESIEPNDMYFDNQWGMHQSEQDGYKPDADIDAPEAWGIIHDADDDIIVAVIDTGVDYTHPKLVPTAFLPSVRTNFNCCMLRIAASARNATQSKIPNPKSKIGKNRDFGLILRGAVSAINTG